MAKSVKTFWIKVGSSGLIFWLSPIRTNSVLENIVKLFCSVIPKSKLAIIKSLSLSNRSNIFCHSFYIFQTYVGGGPLFFLQPPKPLWIALRKDPLFKMPKSPALLQRVGTNVYYSDDKSLNISLPFSQRRAESAKRPACVFTLRKLHRPLSGTLSRSTSGLRRL